jgi:hypothetical protein
VTGVNPAHYSLPATELLQWAELWERAAHRCMVHARRWAERARDYRELAEMRRI